MFIRRTSNTVSSSRRRRAVSRRRQMLTDQLETRCLLTGNFELLKDINTEPNTWPPETNSNPGNFVGVGDYTFFTATTVQHGQELWKTNGTEDGTLLVRDIFPGGDRGCNNSIDQRQWNALFSSHRRCPWC